MWDITFETRGGWINFIGSLVPELIEWQSKWLGIESSIIEIMNTGRAPIAGLNGFTFYIPFRITRQMGVRPSMTLLNRNPHEMPGNDHTSLTRYSLGHESRRSVDSNSYSSILLPSRYKKWLLKDLESRGIVVEE